MNRFSAITAFAALGLAAACTGEATAPPAVKSSLVAPASRSGDHVVGPTVVVITPSNMNGWYFWNDKDETFTGSPGELVVGPGTPPLGVGSVRLGPLTDNGATGAGHSVIATNAYFGTKLTNITGLAYSTFQPGPTLAIALQFDVRYRTSDTGYGGRLVFEPYQNGAVTVGSGWQPWSPLTGKWWASKTTAAGSGGAQVVALPAGNCSPSAPCTWAQINAAFPDAAVSGRFLLKAGSNWNGFDGNADALTVSVAGAATTFDFEPYNVAISKDDCKRGGWKSVKRADGSSFKNQGACESYVKEGRKDDDDKGNGKEESDDDEG